MNNFTCLFPHGNPMGYETETAIRQDIKISTTVYTAYTL